MLKCQTSVELTACQPFAVLERAHVSQRDAEVFDRDRRCQRQSVRGAVCHTLHTDHVSAQTGELNDRLR